VGGPEYHFVVVGAGLAGTLMACYLGRAGYRVRVLEKRPDPRAEGFAGGRSINLALSTRGIAALREVGLADRVLADAIPMRGRLMHSVDGDLSFQRYGTEADQVINSISREGLNIHLLNEASRFPGVEFSFGVRCKVDLEAPSVAVEHPDGGAEVVAARSLIGADGAYSTVRSRMQRRDRFDYSQEYLTHGYKELSIPPAEDGGFRMEVNALHIWPRGGFMMIALPNADASYTCTIFWPFEGENSFSAVRTESEIRDFFGRQFPDAVPHMPTLVEDYLANPTSSLLTVRCSPWNVGGRAVLIGDAAHAIVPFYGQGMNASFEDCSILNRLLEEHGSDLAGTFESFARQRKPDADAIADLALRNFVEMRDRVASPLFLMRKALGRAAHRFSPRWFVPIYSMVTFSTIPYAEAVERERRQNRRVGIIAVTAIAALLTLLVAL
jgi:kynurenine 3-monooxygenase